MFSYFIICHDEDGERTRQVKAFLLIFSCHSALSPAFCDLLYQPFLSATHFRRHGRWNYREKLLRSAMELTLQRIEMSIMLIERVEVGNIDAAQARNDEKEFERSRKILFLESRLSIILRHRRLSVSLPAVLFPNSWKTFTCAATRCTQKNFFIFDLCTARQVCQLQNVTAMRTMFAYQKHIWPADTKNFNKSYGIQKAKIATIWWTISIYFIDFQSP